MKYLIIFIEKFNKILIFRHILREMSLKQLKARYAGSMLGIWWAVITPLILAISIGFVFNKVFKVNIPNNAFFILSGIMPWFFFTNALQEASNSFITSSSILKQGIFPREFIPISIILTNFLNFLIGLLILLPLFIFINVNTIKVLLFLFPIVILNLIFVVGLGILLSYGNVFFRDISHFISIAFMPWFWITPIFYTLDMVPANLRWICYVNPMTYYTILYQSVLFKAAIPPLPVIFITTLISLLSFTFGYFIFIKKEALLLKRI